MTFFMVISLKRVKLTFSMILGNANKYMLVVETLQLNRKIFVP